MAELKEKVFIDANVLVKGGSFLAKDFIMYASDEDKKDALIIEPTNKENNTFEVTDFYGSPYVDYYMSGGFTMIDGEGKITPEILSDNLLERTLKGLNDIRELLSVELSNTKLYPLFYREQHMAIMAEFENFLFCLILREMIFNREKLLGNIREFDYGEDILGFKKHINKTDSDLYEIVKVRTSKLVYHKFDRVALLYKIVFGKDISPFLGDIQKEEDKRHNIVHRNGRYLNGVLDKLSKEEVVSFLDNAEESIKNIWNLIKL